MLNTVTESVVDIDVVLFMVDCTKKVGEQEKQLLSNCFASKTKVILVLNKIDLLSDKSELALKIAQLSGEYPFTAVIPISVKDNDGIDLVVDEVKKLAVESPHYFPDDMITDQPEKVIASEIIREKLLNLLEDEVPHGIAVGVETMKERDTAKGETILDVTATIYCERESHKGIIIGKGGSMLKKASTYARQELENFFQIKVNLQCWVKVKEDWRNREGIIKNFGLSEK
jgi:GTP-binding protein Era